MTSPKTPSGPLEPDSLAEALDTLRRTCRFLSDYGKPSPVSAEDPEELANLLRGVLDKLDGVEEQDAPNRRDSEPPLAA